MLGWQPARQHTQRNDAAEQPDQTDDVEHEHDGSPDAMKAHCIQAVNQAAGRELSAAEIQRIEDRVAGTMRDMARRDPAAWRAMSADQRVIDASREAMSNIQREADLKVQRAQLQILKTAATEQRIGDTLAAGHKERSGALVHDIEQSQGYVQSIKHESMGHLMDLVDAVKSREGAGPLRRLTMFLFDTDNPRMTRDLAREMFSKADGSSGNKTAQAGARAWLDTINGMRERFNRSGGDVGQLDYGYIPQPHDQMRVRGKGDTAARDAWVEKTLPLLDRRQYLNEDGTGMGDAQVTTFLQNAWETIASGGLNKSEPGARPEAGAGMRANKGSESRQIHFKDAESYLTYMSQYGAGSMYDAMSSHVGGMARSIGLVERYGPNPNAQMRLQMDLAERADGGIKRSFGLRPQSYWDVVNGTASTAQDARIALVAMTARNIETFGKLQSALLASLTDLHTFFVTTGFNKLSYWQAMKDVASTTASKDTRDFLTMHGIIAESMAGDLNRWAGDNIRNNWSGRLANSTMKVSLLTAWTDSLRRGFSLTMMRGMAKLAETDWKALTEYDRWRMEHAGITEADWGVIRQAQLTEHNGAHFLTPEAIRSTGHERVDEITTKVLNLITDESEHAVLNPDLATRAITTGGGAQRGTVRGELARAVMQFKAFPIALISRHWRRMLDTPQGLEGAPIMANRLAYGAAFMLSSAALGAIAFQAKQIVQGKDPIDMTEPKFWLRALAQGGGLGIVGDFLLTDPTQSPGDAAANAFKSAAGPIAGSMADVGLKLGIANIYKAANGKETHAAAEALNITRSHLPYVNLWYAKAAIDHMGMHALQENLSPGYLSRMKQRAQQDFKQGYWWQPGTGGPDRAPDLGAAVGN
ncbi:hypothetical protein ACKZDW_04295 (plasmid) [Ralstonia syzygii subsp. celebesensis]